MPRFQSGGTLADDGLYVARAADRELPEALARGEFCCVLAPRQMGKSSLRARAQRRLRERGVRCATIDLGGIGASATTEELWYGDLVELVARRLGLGDEAADGFRAHGRLSPAHRWSRFLRDAVLADGDSRVVIFVDEIDAVLALPRWRDDFFGTLRAVYNSRADDPAYARLAFCLLGVASPRDLASDPARTPFNVGRAIRLEDFTRAEAEPFARALGDGALLDAVYAWTAGHPYMTQRLCEELAARGPDGRAPGERVAELVAELFLARGRVEDANLAYAEKQFARDGGCPLAAEMLRLYARLVGGEPVSTCTGDRDDEVQLELRLAGMAAEREGALRVRNRIFANVFDAAWIKEKEADRLLARQSALWHESGRRRGYLLRGGALDEAIMRARRSAGVGAEEREFLMAGLEERQRARGRANVGFASLSLVLALLLGGGLWLFRQARALSALRIDAERSWSDYLQARIEALEARRAADEAHARAEDLRRRADAESREKRDAEQRADEARRAAQAARQAEARAEAEEADAKQAGLEANQKRQQAEAAMTQLSQLRETAERALAVEHDARVRAEQDRDRAQQELSVERRARESAESALESARSPPRDPSPAPAPPSTKHAYRPRRANASPP